MKNKTRYAIVMILCIIINQLFYTIATKLQLPVWLDVTGTALAALILEPTAGILVGLVNNFYLAVFIFDSSSLLYFGISAMVAVVVGTLMRKEGVIQLKRIAAVLVIVFLLSSAISWILTLWRDGGISNALWERHYSKQALALGFPIPIACLWGILVIKLYDTIVTAVLVAVLYLLMPKCLKRGNTICNT